MGRDAAVYGKPRNLLLLGWRWWWLVLDATAHLLIWDLKLEKKLFFFPDRLWSSLASQVQNSVLDPRSVPDERGLLICWYKRPRNGIFTFLAEIYYAYLELAPFPAVHQSSVGGRDSEISSVWIRNLRVLRAFQTPKGSYISSSKQRSVG